VIAEHSTVYPLDYDGPAKPAWSIGVGYRPNRSRYAYYFTVSQPCGPADLKDLISELCAGGSSRVRQRAGWVITLTKLYASSYLSDAGIYEIQNRRSGNHRGAWWAGIYLHEVFQSGDVQAVGKRTISLLQDSVRSLLAPIFSCHNVIVG